MSTSLIAFGYPLFTIPVDNSFAPSNISKSRTKKKEKLQDNSLNSSKSEITDPDSKGKFANNELKAFPISNKDNKKLLSFTSILEDDWEQRIANFKAKCYSFCNNTR